MSRNDSHVAAELGRYRSLLEPLVATAPGGGTTLPAEERSDWEPAVATLRSYHGNHLDLEEAVAAFARALWAAPGWVEPPALIAEALVVRCRHWPERERAELLALARALSDRALALDGTAIPARIAVCRVRLALGLAEEAERAAAAFPTDHPAALAVRSEVAEARGDRAEAIRLRRRQVETETEPLVLREARNKLGLLHQAQGELAEAEAVHRDNVARHPDYAWGRVNLGATLEARGELVEAYAEVEAAVGFALVEARPFLDELGAALDRRSLESFRRLLRGGRDGDPVDLCPTLPAGPA